METIRQNKANIENNEMISIFDLGNQASDMLVKWKEIKEQVVLFKEFPDIDFHQTINDQSLMEIILELAVMIDENKKLLAKQRQTEGIAKAREKGIKLGRREKVIPENFIEIYEQVIAKKITLKTATEKLNVDYKTYRKWAKLHEENI